jgi:hypothetical protein
MPILLPLKFNVKDSENLKSVLFVLLWMKTKIRTYFYCSLYSYNTNISSFPDRPSINNEGRQPKTGQMFAKNDTVTPENV